MDDFRGELWGYGGPMLLTRVLKQICKTNEIEKMMPENCWGFKVFPPNEFYAIKWSLWAHFFNANYTAETLAATQNSTAIHVWNKFSHGQQIKKATPQTAYEVIAEKNCPKVFKASGDYF